MRRLPVALLALVLIFILPPPASRAAFAGTLVSGTLAGNTTWNLSGSPYIVSEDVTVPLGITLTVEPGVEVRFDTAPPASHSIRAFGRVLSVGRADLRVLFTSNASFPDRNDWVSIQLLGSVGSVFENTTFMWGSITLDVQQASPRIANNAILESGLRAIQVIGPNATPLIEGNFIATQLFNQRVGIIVQDADPVIRNNLLQDNYFGIFVYLGGRPRIENNTIRNGWRGVLVVSAAPIMVNNTIEGNGLPNFGGEGIILFDSAATLVGNVIRNNGVGVDLPYSSKRTLALSRGNTVNGVPLETHYRYRVRDAVLTGLDLDSGHAAGYTGNATQQGLLTFYDSVNVTVAGARLRNNEALVFAANSSLVVANSTFTNSTSDFLLTSISQIASLNNEFRISAVNLTDQRSTLTVMNFLHVQTLSETSTPLGGVHVRVTQDGLVVWNRTTGPDGWSRWNVATYGVISSVGGSPAPVFFRSSVQVAVDHPVFRFRGNPRPVNMSQSHIETFRQTDQTLPRVVDTIPAKDSVGVRFGSRITITFSEPMNRTATEAAIQVLGYGAEDFQWSPDGRSVSFTIRGGQYGMTYFVEVRDTATDLAGNRMAGAYTFDFDIEREQRRVDLVPLWVASGALLAAGLVVVAWRRSRSRAKALRKEEGEREEQRQA